MQSCVLIVAAVSSCKQKKAARVSYRQT